MARAAYEVGRHVYQIAALGRLAGAQKRLGLASCRIDRGIDVRVDPVFDLDDQPIDALPQLAMSEDEAHPARLTLDEFQALTIAWRKRARGADLTTCRIADALESVLRRRIVEARAQQRALEMHRRPQTWWKLW